MALFHPTVSNGSAPHEELYIEGGARRAYCVRAEEDDPLSPSTSPSRSPSPSPPPHRALLDKPLEQLTEEDIMHLTREDCRRYLKQKGMRRPSWNKSQAIQQVLSLKGLFDSKGDEEKSFRPLPCPKKLNSEPSCDQEAPERGKGALYTPQTSKDSLSQLCSSPKIFGNEVCSNSGKVSPSQGRKDVHAMHQPGGSQLKCPGIEVSAVDNTLSRSSSAYMCATDQITETSLQMQDSHFSLQQNYFQCAKASGLLGMEQSAQLTIFYAGMVNVYDDVPEDKARAIMLLAARSSTPKPPLLCSRLQDLVNIPMVTQGSKASSHLMPRYVHSTIATTEVYSTTACPTASLPIAESFTANQSEHQPSRKACLQRYLEKRRGRYAVRNPYITPVKRADGDGLSNRPLAERYNFGSFVEMVAPSMALERNSSQVQLPTQSSSGSESSSSPHLQSCSSS